MDKTYVLRADEIIVTTTCIDLIGVVEQALIEYGYEPSEIRVQLIQKDLPPRRVYRTKDVL